MNKLIAFVLALALALTLVAVTKKNQTRIMKRIFSKGKSSSLTMAQCW